VAARDVPPFKISKEQEKKDQKTTRDVYFFSGRGGS